MRRALVVGGSGLVGTHLLRALLDAGEWEVIATQRQAPLRQPATHRIAALDLAAPADSGRVLSGLGPISHVFFLARLWSEGYVIGRDANVSALAVILDALQGQPSLEHVQVVHGLKWYGSTRGSFPTPAIESDPPPDPDHFYVAQRQLLIERQAGRAWHWSTLRPHCVSGVAVGSPSNLMLGMAVYAALADPADGALAFPATEAAFQARLSYTDADLLAAAMCWAATATSARNQDFNVANGDTFSWAGVWPAFAAGFGRTAGPAQPKTLHRMMPGLAERWRTLSTRFALRESVLARLVDWHFMDATLALGWDQVMSVDKLHRLGFERRVDTPAMIDRLLDGYRRLAILPPS